MKDWLDQEYSVPRRCLVLFFLPALVLGAAIAGMIYGALAALEDLYLCVKELWRGRS